MMAEPLEEFTVGDVVYALRHNRIRLATVIKTTETRARLQFEGLGIEAWRKKALITHARRE